MQGQAKTRRHFTEAAREAALAKRREIAARPKETSGTLNLFIVRGAERGNDFGWEIRRFGAIVVARSPCGYPAATAARRAGEEALRSVFRGGGASPDEIAPTHGGNGFGEVLGQ